MTRREIRSQFLNSRFAIPSLAVILSLVPSVAKAADKGVTEQERVKASGEVLTELINSPSGIPPSVLNKAECVIILPSVKKAGFIVAASYGRGMMSTLQEKSPANASKGK